VFPDAPAALPPNPVCDAIHDEPLVVVEHLDNQVQIIGSCSGKALATIPNITLPLQVDIMQDLSHAIVTSFPGALYFIDLSTYKVSSVMSLNLHNPSGIAISPDGKLAYVTDYGDTGALLVIDIQKQQIVNSIPTPVYPQGVFLTPDGTRAWVTFPFSQEVMVFDTLTLTLVKTLGANEPKTIAFNSTGTLAFLVYHASNTVAVIDATTFAAVRSIPTGAGANEIGIAPDDSFAAVNCYDGSQLTIINLSNYSSVTMSLPGQPLGLSLRY
jgi:DNA-binding beta-propeller fold protein YncE